MPTPEEGSGAAADDALMRRCFALTESARGQGEAPYGAVIGRRGEFVCEALNKARADHDVTHHAELMAISEAQRILGRLSLDDCTLYSIVEPCPMCAYAVRETRIARVVYSLSSPVMGGHSRWNILEDQRLSGVIPEVFAPPPVVSAGFLAAEAAEVMKKWNSLFWEIIQRRHLISKDGGNSPSNLRTEPHQGNNVLARLGRWIRTYLVDSIWRS
jgi:tRNA(adenine34) deaminase